MAKPASRVLRTGGLWFNGIDGYVRIPSFTRPQSFTILIRASLRTTDSENPGVSMFPVEFSICFWRRMRFNAWTTEDWKSVFSPFISWNTNWWYFVGVSFNASAQTVAFYRDLEVYGPYSYPYTIRELPSCIDIGKRGTAAYYVGCLDEVLIYNRVLSDAERYEIYSKGTFIKDGLVLYLPFYEGEGNIAHDVSGYNNHGTIYGGTAWVVKKALRVLPKAR